VAYRLRERGVNVSVATFSGSEKLPESPDVVFIGNGPWAAAALCLELLRAHTQTLKTWLSNGASFFAVGTGAEILSENIVSARGSSSTGLGIFPFSAHRDQERLVGYNTCESPLGQIVGFYDLSSVWVRNKTASPLGRCAIGPYRVAREDGVLIGTSIATQIGGPLLALNPHVADWIIQNVATRRNLSLESSPLAADPLAKNARQAILDNMDQVFSTMAL
jgi:CobQ-like glutamine amidotransferase family enzyme